MLMVCCPCGVLGTTTFQRDSGYQEHEPRGRALWGEPIGGQPARAGGGTSSGSDFAEPRQTAPGTDPCGPHVQRFLPRRLAPRRGVLAVAGIAQGRCRGHGPGGVHLLGGVERDEPSGGAVRGEISHGACLLYTSPSPRD